MSQAPRRAPAPPSAISQFRPKPPPPQNSATPAPVKENAKLDEVNDKVAKVKTVLKENLEMAIERGEHLEEMENKSLVLLDDSSKFEQSAKATRKMFCRRHWRNIIIIAIILGVFLGLIIWWASS